MTTGSGGFGRPAAQPAGAPVAPSNARAAIPGTLDSALEQAVHLLKAGHALEAEQQIRLILTAVPQEPNALFLLAKARHQQGDSSQALALLDGLIARPRNWLSVHQEKGLILS